MVMATGQSFPVSVSLRCLREAEKGNDVLLWGRSLQYETLVLRFLPHPDEGPSRSRGDRQGASGLGPRSLASVARTDGHSLPATVLSFQWVDTGNLYPAEVFCTRPCSTRAARAVETVWVLAWQAFRI